jgi:hypothetical protein
MVHKLKYLGENKNNLYLRVYMSDVISQINDSVFIDNPNIQNKFKENDMKITTRKM